MRTTLDVDDDVLSAAREIARRRGVAMGRVLSDLARQALAEEPRFTMRNGIPQFPIRPGAGIVTPELVRRLLDEEP